MKRLFYTLLLFMMLVVPVGTDITVDAATTGHMPTMWVATNEAAADLQTLIVADGQMNHSAHDPVNDSSNNESEEEKKEVDWLGMLFSALRIVEMLVVILLTGLLFFRVCVWRGESSELPSWIDIKREKQLAALLLLTIVGTGFLRIWSLAAQWGTFGNETMLSVMLRTLQLTGLGTAAWVRALLVALWLVVLFLPQTKGWSSRIRLGSQVVIGLLLLMSFPLTGHASALDGPKLLAVISHLLHLLAAAVWIGGMLGLGAVLSRRYVEQYSLAALHRMVLRFSRYALPLLILMVISGIVLTVIRLSSWGHLFGTSYGQLVLVKSGLLLLIVLIAVGHHRIFIPLMKQAESGNESEQLAARQKFRKALLLEIGVAALLIIFAGILSGTPPPDKWEAAEPMRWHVMGEEAHMTLYMREEAEDKQLYRLDVWLRTGSGDPASVAVKLKQEGKEVAIPVAFLEGGPDPYGFEGFDKYRYEVTGDFLPGIGSIEYDVEVMDLEGQRFTYNKVYEPTN